MDRLEEAKRAIGYRSPESTRDDDADLLQYLNLKLAAQGLPIYGAAEDFPLLKLSNSLLDHVRVQNRYLANRLCPADAAIQQFLAAYLQEFAPSTDTTWLPTNTLVLERHGLARMLSLPPDRDKHESPILSSYRTFQGICHNPVKDRRTTEGVFHIVEGGFAVPADKKETPRRTFAALLQAAKNPPAELNQLPFTAHQAEHAEQFVSLLLRPLVCPEVAGFTPRKSIEVRFFAPGSLAANLDFVESIFGNAGDPYQPENDARLDVEHWSGHTGCVILAPHLVTLTKKEVGLPHISDASPRQIRDGMCWTDEHELYNNGNAFKLTCRDHRGVIVTLIADNYFGYCKKEVKAQISYAANLMGQCEEEHAGGALAFPSFDLGEDFEQSTFRTETKYRFREVVEQYGEMMHLQPAGYGIDKQYANIVYLPEDARIDLRQQKISWRLDDEPQTLPLRPEFTYVMPSGYRVIMQKPTQGVRWRLVGTSPEGTYCHKPCTVSGGGKSEISKPITDAMISGPIVTYDFKRDFDQVEEIIHRDFSNRYQEPLVPGRKGRELLAESRSLGSVVRLLTPSPEYTDEYNEWIAGIPRHIRDLVLLLKRFHKPHWNDWRRRFSVDLINGQPGYELKFRKQKLLALLIRVGFTEDGSWRTFSLRKDFYAAEKLQTEDDITASIVVPEQHLQHLHPNLSQFSYKFSENCEYRLFQRPDEAIVRGYDKTAELDFSRQGNFFSNYEPLTRKDAQEMIGNTIEFEQYSKPIRRVIRRFVKEGKPDYFVSTACPRIVNGAPSTNPRYLQTRPDLEDPRRWYLAEIGSRMFRRIPLDHPVPFPVNSVLPGRRNNPADYSKGVRPLAVYNPIHYQELPELFMEFISSLTGKSPSTTGAGSEGALTKGPFNSMPPIIDLNNALVSYLLTGNPSFTTSAGFIGPKYRFDHDISLLIPEVWSRMFVDEREPDYLIQHGYLEPMPKLTHNGKALATSRLGYRITEKFIMAFFGRIFSDPTSLFTEEMLRPERQSLDEFADGIHNICETQQRIAKLYFDDNTVELACPPLRALLHIMAHGNYDGKTELDPEIRAMFTRDALLKSDWYAQRLKTQQQVDIALWKRHVASLKSYLSSESHSDHREQRLISSRLELAQQKLKEVQHPSYLEFIHGSIGTDPAVRR
ncbi:MAG: hypothetical protein KDA92_00320 [Planctomycetales bacterium]|nr:hypothetical protein [Planctomycetales bacterium]MCA9167046.1 hypothetical protein [Planctomycetales bacterium]